MTTVQTKLDIPRDAPLWQAWTESMVLTLAVLLLGRWLSPDDPFFTRAGFPWAVLAPLLAGLRHGVATGAGSSVVLMIGMAITWRQAPVELGPLPLHTALAFLLVGILAGGFANMWRRRTHRLVTSLEYSRLRLEEFTRTYHILKVSFDALHRQNLTDPHNLREALITFRQQLAGSTQRQDSLLGLAEAILGLFADFAQIYAAALFPVEEDGALAPRPAARLGRGEGPAWDDPLLTRALTSKLLASVGADFRGREQETQLLVAIPLVDVTGRVWGVIGVRDMHFLSLQGMILQRLAVLGGHVADLLAFHRPVTNSEEFRQRVERCRSDARQFGLAASALCVTPNDGAKSAELLATLVDQRRGLDAAYHARAKTAKQGACLLLLLPLTDEVGLLGYRERLARLVHERQADTTSGDGLAVDAFVLKEEQDFERLLGMLDNLSSGGTS